MKLIQKNIRTGLAGMLLLFATTGIAQDSVKTEVKIIPFQLTLISPMGTNGLTSGKVANNASINILAGISGGVKGGEIGGIANFSKGDIIGLQAAGMFNGSLGDLKGLQLGGLVNFNKGLVVGSQASGIANVNTNAIVGLQLGGLFNYASDSMKGIQAAGMVNTMVGEVKGVQFSGITNLATKTVTGTQITGIANTVVGDLTGLQFSGIVNVVTKKMDGVQISLINYARKVKGVQFGLINVSDTVEKGIPIGLFTYVRHGYHKFELEANETFYANATFKSGVQHFYSIFTIGFKNQNGINYWSPGVGIGTLSHLSKKLDFNADFVFRHVNEGEWWTDELNILNTLSLNLAYKVSDRLSIYGGPSINLSKSGITDNEGNLIGESFSPDWEFYDETNGDSRVKMYVGFKAGIRF